MQDSFSNVNLNTDRSTSIPVASSRPHLPSNLPSYPANPTPRQVHNNSTQALHQAPTDPTLTATSFTPYQTASFASVEQNSSAASRREPFGAERTGGFALNTVEYDPDYIRMQLMQRDGILGEDMKEISWKSRKNMKEQFKLRFEHKLQCKERNERLEAHPKTMKPQRQVEYFVSPSFKLQPVNESSETSNFSSVPNGWPSKKRISRNHFANLKMKSQMQKQSQSNMIDLSEPLQKMLG